jgi:hypothetical protein
MKIEPDAGVFNGLAVATPAAGTAALQKAANQDTTEIIRKMAILLRKMA